MTRAISTNRKMFHFRFFVAPEVRGSSFLTQLLEEKHVTFFNDITIFNYDKKHQKCDKIA